MHSIMDERIAAEAPKGETRGSLGLLASYFIPGCEGREARLGPEISSIKSVKLQTVNTEGLENPKNVIFSPPNQP